MNREDQTFAFEDAIKKSGFGKFNYILIVLSGGLMSSAFLELTSVNIILPIAQCDLDLTTSDKGILSAIGYVGTIMSSHLWGFLADTQGRKKTLVPSLACAFTATIISSLVNNFWLLVFLRFLNGFFISCASSTTFAFLGEFHDARNRARVLMITSILYSVISFLLPTFAILTVNQEWSYPIEFLGVTYKPWRLFLVACGLPSLACGLVLTFCVPESPKYVFSQGDEEGTLMILRKIYQMNTGQSVQSYPVKGLIKDGEFGESTPTGSENFFKFMWTQSVPLFKGSHLRNILTACFIQFSVCNTSNGFWTFFPEIMNKIGLWTDASRGSATVCEIFTDTNLITNHTEIIPVCVDKLESSTFLHMYELVLLYAVSYAVLSFVINLVGKLVLIVFFTASCGICAFLLIFVSNPLASSYLYLFMILAGCTISVVNASSVELFPTKMRAMAICISMMVGRIGSTVGSLVIGINIDKNCEMTFLMPTILLGISAVLAFTIPNISKRVK